MLDGLSVWAREVVRPPDEQSPGIIEHEARRAYRLADRFEAMTGDPILNGPLTMARIYLFGSLDVERRLPAFAWREGRPGLVDWHARISEMPAIKASAPPVS
jgi:glutathione S-transferase